MRCTEKVFADSKSKTSMISHAFKDLQKLWSASPEPGWFSSVREGAQTGWQLRQRNVCKNKQKQTQDNKTKKIVQPNAL